MIFLFKDSQNFILYESAEDRNLFLPTRMLYLHAKNELVSLDRLSSRGLWNWSNSRGFGPATIWRGAAFHFLAVFSKMKILWNFDCDFLKCFTKGFFSDWKWSISKFRFWRWIPDIYRQPLSKKSSVDCSRIAEKSWKWKILLEVKTCKQL